MQLGLAVSSCNKVWINSLPKSEGDFQVLSTFFLNNRRPPVYDTACTWSEKVHMEWKSTLQCHKDKGMFLASAFYMHQGMGGTLEGLKQGAVLQIEVL